MMLTRLQDWAPAFAMAAVYGIFFAEVAAYRIGTSRLEKLGVAYSSHNDDATDAHAHNHRIDPPLNVDISGQEADPHHAHPSLRAGAEAERGIPEKHDESSSDDDSTLNHLPSQAEAIAQLIAVGVLEFGVILHR